MMSFRKGRGKLDISEDISRSVGIVNSKNPGYSNHYLIGANYVSFAAAKKIYFEAAEDTNS